jgi:hypothetical protein
VRACVYACVCERVRVCMRACVRVRAQVCVYVCVHVRVHVCVCMHECFSGICEEGRFLLKHSRC